MLRFDALHAPSLAASVQQRPVAHAGSSGNPAFSALFREIHDEVQEFIEVGAESFDVQPYLGAAMLGAQGQFIQSAVTAGAANESGDEVFLAAARGVNQPEQQAFLESIAPFAKEAAEQLGVSPAIIAAHAALESGWGQRPLRNPDGSSTHNLFGIKATRNWNGDVVNARTTEYEEGVPQAKIEPFRSFPDQASAFRSFVQLMKGSPRYQAALNTGNDAQAYAKALARGGYATDPAYASKLTQLAARIQSGS